MGTFHSSFHVYHDDPEQVFAALSGLAPGRLTVSDPWPGRPVEPPADAVHVP